MRIFNFHSQPHVSPYTHAERSLGFARTTRAETRASSAHTWGAPMDAKDGRNGAKGTRYTKTEKIVGEFCHHLSHFYHKKTVNKKRVETKEGIQKKILGTRKKIYKLPPAKIKKERRDHCADARRRDGYDANTLTPENATVLTRCAAAKLHVTP